MPKGQRWSEEFKRAVREAYMALPRSSGKWARHTPMKRGVRVLNGHIAELRKRFGGISEVMLWKIVYDLQPWNKGRT